MAKGERAGLTGRIPFRLRDVNMTEGPVLSRMFVYTLPLMMSGILQLLYNAADVAVVGRYAADKQTSLAAVGSTGSLTNLIIGLFMGLSVGCCVVVSRYLGSGEKKNASETVHTSILTGLILGVILAFVGILFSKPLLRLMKSPDSVIDLASLYMKIYFIGLPVSMLYNFGSSVLRAKGDTFFPLIVLVVSGSVNVSMNLILVKGFHLDVAGVAAATVCSQAVSAAMVLIHLSRLPGDDPCKLYFRRIGIWRDKLFKIIAVGIPAGAQGVLFSVSNVILQTAVNSLGDVAMAGNTAASNIDGFIYIACNSVYHSAVSFTGQNYGAHNFGRIKKVAWSSVFIVTAVGLAMGSVAFFFAKPLLSIYAPGAESAAVREYGLLRLRITALTYFMCGLMEVATGLLRGLNRSILPMSISFFGSCVLRVCWVYFLFYPYEYFNNMFWLWMTYPISWFITAGAEFLVFFIVFRKITVRNRESGGEAGGVSAG